MSIFGSRRGLMNGSIYVFKRDFDAYLCGVGRVQVAKNTVCQCTDGGEGLYFFNSKNKLPYEAVQLIEASPDEYLDDITAMYVEKYGR